MLLATILGGIVLLFLLFIVVVSIASMADTEMKIEANSILVLDLNNQIYERADDNPFAAFDPISGALEEPLGLNDILASIKKAKTDDNIQGIYIKGGVPLAGVATVMEIRDALLDFRTGGKFVYSFSEIMTQKGLVVASAADSVIMNPEGFVEWGGLSSAVMYYKDGLEKLGVEPVVLRADNNKYKSFVEPYLRNEMSPENREQITALLTSLWDDYLGAVGEGRGLSNEQLDHLADTLAFTNPVEAAKVGLISRTGYEDELLGLFMKRTDTERPKDLPFISLQRYSETANLGTKTTGDRIAVVIAQGDIVSGDAGEYSIGSDRMAKAIRKAREDKKIKAIVLRVNSPGGSALASEVIWREIQLAKMEKPVVVSMGDVAASGGYYIACLADTIVAQPTTVTGSIGVFGLFFTAEELLNEKLGINIETVKTNKYSDLGTIDRDLSKGERAMLIRMVNQTYDVFKQRVAEGRGLPREIVDSLAGGRVYSGREAMALGLVDVMGGLDDAIEIARNMAGIGDEYRIVELPRLEDPITRFLNQYKGEYEEEVLQRQLGEYARYFDLLQQIKNGQGIQARMGFDLEID